MTQAEKIELVAVYDGWIKVGYAYLGGELMFQRKLNDAFGYDNKIIDNLKYLTSLDWLHPVAMKVLDDVYAFNTPIGSRIYGKIFNHCASKPKEGQYLDLFEAVVEGIVFINEQKFKTK